MNFIYAGIAAIAASIVMMWLYGVIKATKDPDVKAASKLGIPINRYHKYKEWYDEHQRLMEQYGINSKEAASYFASFSRQIKYPNEWRRYQQSRYMDTLDDMWRKIYKN